MEMSRRAFTREFKIGAINELKSGKSVGYVARRLEVNPNLLYRWRREFAAEPTKAFSGHGRQMLAESREAELERKIGQMAMENDFLKKLLRSFEEQQALANGDGWSTRKSRKKKSSR